MTKSTPFISTAELRAAGVAAPWVFGRRDWVRSGEIDALSHTNNTVYLGWFETVRVGYLRTLVPWIYPRYQTALKSLTADYHKQTVINEEYLVVSRTRSFRTTSFVQEYAVLAPDLRTSGTAVVVLVEAETGKKVPLPEELREYFLENDGAEDLR